MLSRECLVLETSRHLTGVRRSQSWDELQPGNEALVRQARAKSRWRRTGRDSGIIWRAKSKLHRGRNGG